MSNMVYTIPLLVSIIGAATSIIVVFQTKRKMENENNEKLATKGYVMDKISKVDTEIVNLKENFKQHKIDNENDKHELKDGYKTEFEYIKQFLNDIKQDLNIIKQKSA
ncbi:MAG: hypothetical protein JXA68_07115 [Ignavibacteriales bacterium]|nr:hypothetical protein [Ignavibacteriales bacterium]